LFRAAKPGWIEPPSTRARAAGLTLGGWCPQGRRAEDGPLDAALYPLRQTPSPEYAQRTAWNVRDSDATLILARGALTGGTALARAEAQAMKRPLFVVDFLSRPDPRETVAWIRQGSFAAVNIAGPRESECPGIYDQAREFLGEVFRALGEETITSS
jgi:hypothetical protein